MDERELVSCAQAGDQAAFEQLVRAYEGKVYAIALRWLGEREDALDASQEVFLRVFRFLRSFDSRSGFSTWLYRIAVNVCKDMTARRARAQEQPLERSDGEDGYALELPDSRYEPETVFAERARGEALQRAIAALPPEQRAVILLRDLRGLSYHDIADALELEEGTVKSRISRARARLRELLLADGNFFTDQQSNPSKGGQSR